MRVAERVRRGAEHFTAEKEVGGKEDRGAKKAKMEFGRGGR